MAAAASKDLTFPPRHVRPRHHRELHARQTDVGAVHGLAHGDVAQVDDLGLALAHEREFVRRLEEKRLARRHRQRHGRFRQLAEAELRSGFLFRRIELHHVMRLRAAERDIDAPLGGGSRLQHLPHRGAAFAHGLNEMAHAARAVGVLVAVARLIARRLHELHARPVRLHLVGDHQGQARSDAGAHLGAMRDDGDRAVGRDRDVDVRIVGHAVAVGHAVSPPVL